MTVAEVGVTETAKSAPLPPKDTTCGLPAALSVIVIEPFLLPSAVGVKVTLMVQLAATARVVPQVLVCAKSPVATMLVIFRAAVPGLLNVTACGGLVVPKGWLAKVKLVGDKLTRGDGRPFPASVIVCGLSDALSVMFTEPYRSPGTVGVKVTLMMQLAPTARLAPQVLVWAKSPLAEMLIMIKVALPVFVRVTVWGALVLPTACPVKVRLLGASVTAGASRPRPVNATV
jgi:hypothetical protein